MVKIEITERIFDIAVLAGVWSAEEFIKRGEKSLGTT